MNDETYHIQRLIENIIYDIVIFIFHRRKYFIYKKKFHELFVQLKNIFKIDLILIWKFIFPTHVAAKFLMKVLL